MDKEPSKRLHYPKHSVEEFLPNQLLLMYRQRAGLTQLELAKKLELKSAKMLQMWEQGYSLPSAPKLKQLLEIYLTLGVLLTNQELEEADQLWTTVKNFFDSRIKTGKSYPLFDWRWFESLLNRKRAGLGLAELVLPPGLPNEESPKAAILSPSVYICPVLIGRQLELSDLQVFLTQKRHRGTPAIFIKGEAGIGKSRLLAEAKRAVLAQDYLLLEGYCYEQSTASPYSPLLDIFRSYFVRFTKDALPDKMKPFVAILSRLLPELALLFPDLAALPNLTENPQEQQRQLFAAMTHFLSEQASDHPVLLVIEDVHWSDDLTLDFLLHLARRSREIPLLLLITIRNDTVSAQVRQWLNQFERERLMVEIPLGPLSLSDIEAMVRAILQPEDFGSQITGVLYTLSEGNPFFVEELLKSFVVTGQLQYIESRWEYNTGKNEGAAGIIIPSSLQMAVQQRAEALSSGAKQVLILAAVAGRSFDFTLLQQALNLDETSLLSFVKELIAAQLVSEKSADQFIFRHALTREAIYGGLLLRERQALHRLLAKTLIRFLDSSAHDEHYMADLAEHCYEAGMWEQALLYEYRLGEKALDLHAQRAAIEHLTRAITAARYLPSALPSREFYARGQAYSTLGEFEPAQNDYRQAIAFAQAAGDNLAQWQAMLALGILWAGRDYSQAGEWFRQALALAESTGDQSLKAASLNRLGNWLLNTGRLEGLQAHHEALKIYEDQQNSEGMAQTLDLLGTAYGMQGNRLKAVENLSGAIILFRNQRNLPSLISSLAMRSIQAIPGSNETTFCSLMSRDECVQDAAEAVSLARQINSLPQLAFAENALGNTLLSFGEFEPAISHIQEARRIASEIEHQQWLVATAFGLGQIYLQLLAPTEALNVIKTAKSLAKQLGSAFWLATLAALEARVYLLTKDLKSAQACLQACMPLKQQPRNLIERQISLVWGELALAQGKAVQALQIAEHLLETPPGIVPGQPIQPIPLLLKLKGEALLTLGRLREAAAALEEARRGAEERHSPAVLWPIRQALAHAYQLLNQPNQAQEEETAVRQLINELASSLNNEALYENFKLKALNSRPFDEVKQPVVTARRKTYGIGGLTQRESQVALLIAQGKTSREIAKLLVVTERTAEVHVSNILGKLGFTSRSQIAAWVVANEQAHH